MSDGKRLNRSRVRGVVNFTRSRAHRRDVGRIDQILKVVVAEVELLDLDFQFLVDRGQFLVDRLQFLFAGLELFGRRTELLVGGLLLFGRGLRFLDLGFVLFHRHPELRLEARQFFLELYGDRYRAGVERPQVATRILGRRVIAEEHEEETARRIVVAQHRPNYQIDLTRTR